MGNKNTPTHKRFCALCQKLISTDSRRRRWCSDNCARIGGRLLRRGFRVIACGRRNCRHFVVAPSSQKARFACSDDHLTWLIRESARTAEARAIREEAVGEPVTWSTAERLAAAAATGNTCGWCGIDLVVRPVDGFSGREVAKEHTLEIDHILPIARGGEHNAENWLASCQPCNRSHVDLLIEEWIDRDRAAGREPRASLVVADLASGNGAWAVDADGHIVLADKAPLMR